MSTTIATYKNLDDANSALELLTKHGVMRDDISIATLEKNTKHLNTENVSSSSAMGDMAGNTVTGAFHGAEVGGILALLAGVAALAIPGFGGLLIVGPLAASLGLTGSTAAVLGGAAVSGAAAGGAVGGAVGLVSGLVSAGVNEVDAKAMEETIKTGGVLISVKNNPSAAMDITNILTQTHPNQINTLA